MDSPSHNEPPNLPGPADIAPARGETASSEPDSTGSSEDNSPGQSNPHRQHRAPIGLRITIAIIGLAVIYGLIAEYPREVARWHAAAALEDYLNNDLPAAIKHLDDAVARAPEDLSLILQRAEYKLKTKDYEGSLEDFNHIERLTGWRSSTILFQIYHGMGDIEKTAEQIEQLEATSRSGSTFARALNLNNLAYFRAVRKTDLKQALKEVEQAIEFDLEIKTKRTNVPKQWWRVWLYWLTGFEMSSNPVVANSSYLDTHGYILFLTGKAVEAKPIMDEAVAGAEQEFEKIYGIHGSARHQLVDHTGQHQFVDFRELEIKKREMARSVAVVRYHRALVLEELGEPDLAKRDYQRIEDLGFEAGDDLY